MARFVSTTAGVGQLTDGGGVRLLALELTDLGAALQAGFTLRQLADAPTRDERPLADVTLLPTIPRPSKIWALGLAYRDHIAEMNAKPDAEPFFFLKAPSALVPSGAAIKLPALAPSCVDYEGEVAFVISRQATNVTAAEAWDHVAGVTILNDVSARDVQTGSYREGARPNTSMAKSFDTFCPLGPCLAGWDALPNRDDIAITTHVNGERRQGSSTAGLVWPVAELVAFLAARTTLMPGDVISTGTPAGVGAPHKRFLQSGDTVRIEVSGVGILENRVA
ncbi:MAG: fumarylacetoacetate hydrolase family protein [Chloroflexota bacterium]